MSLYDYQKSLEISAEDPPFASLIMAALRKADTDNVALIRQAWPEISAEFTDRYWALNGVLPDDQ